MHARTYEGSHKLFKSLHEKTPKRKRSAINETVVWLNMQMGSSSLSTNVKQKLGSTNLANAFAKIEDCADLVRSAAKTSLASLEALLSCLSSGRIEYFLVRVTDDNSRQLGDRLQEDGLRPLCRLLIEHLKP